MATNVATLSSLTAVSLPLSSSRSSFYYNCFTVTTRPYTRSLVAFRPEQRRNALTCNALFGLGVPELAVIAGVAALLFGPKKLPEIGKSLGKTVKSFQQVCSLLETLVQLWNLKVSVFFLAATVFDAFSSLEPKNMNAVYCASSCEKLVASSLNWCYKEKCVLKFFMFSSDLVLLVWVLSCCCETVHYDTVRFLKQMLLCYTRIVA